MRLKTAIVVGAVIAFGLLLCVAVAMDRCQILHETEPVFSEAVLAVTEEQKTHTSTYDTSSRYTTSPIETSEDEEPFETPVAEYQSTHSVSYNNDFMDGFIIEIRNTKISVGYDTSEEALEKRPGWLNTSAYPGEEGICIIYGHRNRKHLRALEKVEISDEIKITADGESVFVYTIYDTYIVDDLSEIALMSTDEPTLVLVTCYPFRYSGSAPQKYVVIAKKEGMTYE